MASDFLRAQLAAMTDAKVLDMRERHLRNLKEAVRNRDHRTAWDEEDAYRLYDWEIRRRQKQSTQGESQ